MKIKTQRVKDMSLIEREVIKMIFDDAIKFPNDGQWRTYKRSITFQGDDYTVTCSFLYDAVNFLYKNLEIIGNTKIIMIDPKDYN